MTKKLSPRAEALLKRVSNSANYYPWEPGKHPKAFDELEAAGLVIPGARIKVVQLYWVPKGCEPPRYEVFPEQDSNLTPELNTRIQNLEKALEYLEMWVPDGFMDRQTGLGFKETANKIAKGEL